MKKSLLILSMLISSFTVAQNPVLNSGFEDWTSGEPDFWTTNNVPGLSITCEQSATSHTGSFALKGIVSSGIVPLYPPSLSSTDANGDPCPVSQLYTNFSFYYQLNLNGSDEIVSGAVVIADAQGSGIGGGNILLHENSNTSVYTQANAPINYFGTGPAGAFITFYISDTVSGSGLALGSYFIIDDVSLNFSSSVEETSNTETLFPVYPNPAVSELNIPFVLKSTSSISLDIYNVMGSKVSAINYPSMKPGSYKEVIDVSILQSGIYTCVMTTSSTRSKVSFMVIADK